MGGRELTLENTVGSIKYPPPPSLALNAPPPISTFAPSCFPTSIKSRTFSYCA